jgi:glycosyltransferase involved in cell wall biosynthesis
MQDRANNRDRVLVIIPAFNEHETLPSTLAELKRTVPDFDVVVIDDGSKDDTADLGHLGDAH